MNAGILEDWQLGFVPTPENAVHDMYRYINSKATKCPDAVEPTEREDPFGKYTFWKVDMTEKLSLELDQFPLGRKFLFQAGLQTRKRSIRTTSVKAPKSAKRKRT